MNFKDPSGHYPCNVLNCVTRFASLLSSWQFSENQGTVNQNQYNLTIYDYVETAVDNAGLSTVSLEHVSFITYMVKRMVGRESHFIPEADNGLEGLSHAQGLMQITDIAMQDFAERDNLYQRFFGDSLASIDRLNPSENIKGGVAHLMMLYSDIANHEYNMGWLTAMEAKERWRFTVAAYNAGADSVNGARDICAGIEGCDPLSWNDVSVYLPTETQTYVNDVFENWQENPADG